jgi:hypothetical protein
MTQPDPTCVSNTAAVLVTLPLEDARNAFRAIIDAMRRGLPAHGFSAGEVETFVIRFSDALVAELNAMPRHRVLH